MRGYTVKNGIMEITDPYEYLQSRTQPAYAFVPTCTSQIKRNYDPIYVIAAQGRSRIFKGLKYDIENRRVLNPKPQRKLVPKKGVHAEYKYLCKKLRNKVRGMINLGVFTKETWEKYAQPDYEADEYTHVERAFREYSVENIVKLLYNYRTRWIRPGEKEFVTYDRALTKAINGYRDVWLEAHDGFEIQ